MDSYLSFQYQAIAQPPSPRAQPGATNAAPWLFPWSEPVRTRIAPSLAIALAASGLFALVPFSGLIPGPRNAAPWIYAWSEPVRIKRALPPTEQHFFEFEPEPPIAMAMPWYSGFSEPVRFKLGLAHYLQVSFTGPARLLPTPNITATMNAKETGKDIALFGINVFNPSPSAASLQGARVAITIIPAIEGGNVSIEK